MRKAIFLVVIVLLGFSVLGIPLVRAEPPYNRQVHIVQPGETLFAIARSYGIRPASLIQANGIVNPNWIYAGQRLIVPIDGSVEAGGNGRYHTVQRGESLYAIAARYSLSAGAVARANGIANPHIIYAGQRLVIPESTSVVGGVHLVQRGETLGSIALRYGVTTSALAQANRLYNPDVVYVWQRLSVPSNESPTTPANPVPSASKLIEVDLSDQRMTVWENGGVKWHWVISTGEPGRATIPGSFSVISKIPYAYSRYYDLHYPWWMGIYWVGNLENGIHALPILPNGQTLWAGLLGSRVSYGCIILDTDNARTLYDWASVGTPVTIHY